VRGVCSYGCCGEPLGRGGPEASASRVNVEREGCESGEAVAGAAAASGHVTVDALALPDTGFSDDVAVALSGEVACGVPNVTVTGGGAAGVVSDAGAVESVVAFDKAVGDEVVDAAGGAAAAGVGV
jgi:hypothetical protein